MATFLELVDPKTLIERLKRHRVGIITGPLFTLGEENYVRLRDLLAPSAGQWDRSETLLESIDLALGRGRTTDEIKRFLHHISTGVDAPPGLPSIAGLPINAVLSLTYDRHFERAMGEKSQENALRKRPEVYSRAAQTIKPGTIPIFKLLGEPLADSCVLGTAKYAVARAKLPFAMRTFSDAVRDFPILCLGIEPVRDIFMDVLAQFAAEPSSHPAELLLLDSDPASKDPEILSRISAYELDALVVRAAPGALAAALMEEEAKSYSGRIQLVSKSTQSDHESFFRRSQVAVLVNSHTTARIPKREIEHLSDILFAPDRYKWDPFVHGIDIRRTVTDGLLDSIRAGVVGSHGNARSAALVRGNAASGKSTLMKRLSLELAAEGYTVLWLRPTNFSYTPETIREMLTRAKGFNADTKGKGIVVFQDDPVRYGTVTPSLLAMLSIAAGSEATFVVAYRNSDYENWKHDGVLANVEILDEEELPDTLDETEWGQLAELIQRIGIARDADDAATMLNNTESRLSRDTLASLHFLVPKSRDSIVSSIREEHVRLGRADALARQFIESPELRDGVCRDALEMVAVAAHYRVLPPVEVLVRAMGISFTEWSALARQPGPVWGVLYEVEDSNGEGECYAPRNEVVTKVVRQAINLGFTDHSGDIARLVSMVSACTGSQALYREFCVRLLVTSNALKELSGDEGRKLYETALSALPHRDKSILHHFGNWLRKKCSDTSGARAVLEQALEAVDSPYATQRESNYHISNSLAALDLQEIQEGKMSRDEGAAMAATHLQQGRDGTATDAHSTHIGANLACELLADFNPKEPRADDFKIASEAISEIHQTLFNLDSFTPAAWKGGDQTAEMLLDVEAKLIARVGEIDDLSATAERMWEHAGSQRGFSMVARKLFHTARSQNKGSPYRKVVDYVDDVVARIEEDDVPVDHALWEVLMQAYYQWRVGRYTHSRSKIDVDWHRLGIAATHATNGGTKLIPPLNAYIYGLSLAHEGEWAESQRIFAEMRKLRLPTVTSYLARDFLYGANGIPMIVQGGVSKDVRVLLKCEDPHYTFVCEERSTWPEDGETAHAEIQFSFAGPKAYPASP